MVQMTPITIRVKFRKVGRLMYISHLDLVRTMMKVIVRAGLPLKYTEGFNPKPKLSFAAPLSCGVESECEYMDIRLEEKLPPQQILDMLSANLTNEMSVLEAYYPQSKFTDLGFLAYDITIDTVGKSELLAQKINDELSRESLFILKKTKSGEREVDIKPLIRSATAEFDGENIKLKCILSSSPSAFLTPELLIRYLKKSVGVLSCENLMSEGYSIMRTEAYFADMTQFK